MGRGASSPTTRFYLTMKTQRPSPWPTGTIRVYSGLMDADRPDDEVRYVIAHEIGHVKPRANRQRSPPDRLCRLRRAHSGRRSGKCRGRPLRIGPGRPWPKSLVNAQFSQSQERGRRPVCPEPDEGEQIRHLRPRSLPAENWKKMFEQRSRASSPATPPRATGPMRWRRCCKIEVLM